MYKLTNMGLEELEELEKRVEYGEGELDLNILHLRNHYLLRQVSMDPNFTISKSSALRPNWDNLITQGYITSTS